MNLRLLILAVLVVISSGLAWWLHNIDSAVNQLSSDAEQTLLTDVAMVTKDIQRIKIENHQGVIFSAVKKDDRWLATHLDTLMTFPADMQQLSQFANMLTDIKVMEAKTAQPDLYSRLGVENVRDEDAQSVLIEIGNQNNVLSLLVGQRAEGGRGTFVRQPEEATSLLIDQNIRLPLDRFSWLSKAVLPITLAEVQTVAIAVSERSPLTLARDPDNNAKWKFVELQDEEAVLTESAESIVADIVNFKYDGVEPYVEDAWSANALLSRTIITLKDGGEVTVQLSQPDEQGVYSLLIQSGQALVGVSDWVFQLSEYQAKPFLHSAATVSQ